FDTVTRHQRIGALVDNLKAEMLQHGHAIAQRNSCALMVEFQPQCSIAATMRAKPYGDAVIPEAFELCDISQRILNAIAALIGGRKGISPVADQRCIGDGCSEHVGEITCQRLDTSLEHLSFRARRGATIASNDDMEAH